MTVKDVAKMIGCSELTVRVGLQQGVFPFGTAFKTKESNKSYVYVIYAEKVREYIGEKQ